MKTKRKAIDWWFWPILVIGTLIGSVIAFFVFFLAMSFVGESGGRIPDLVASLILTICFGSVIGIAQWFVLRRYVPRTAIWIGATSVGFLICSPIIFFLSGGFGPYLTPRASLIMTFVLGGVMGIMQWFTIYKKVKQSALWIGISLVSWIVAGLIGMALKFFSWQMAPVLYWPGLLFFGTVLSAAGLMWLLKRGARSSDEQQPDIGSA